MLLHQIIVTLTEGKKRLLRFTTYKSISNAIDYSIQTLFEARLYNAVGIYAKSTLNSTTEIALAALQRIILYQ